MTKKFKILILSPSGIGINSWMEEHESVARQKMRRFTPAGYVGQVYHNGQLIDEYKK